MYFVVEVHIFYFTVAFCFQAKAYTQYANDVDQNYEYTPRSWPSVTAGNTAFARLPNN